MKSAIIQCIVTGIFLFSSIGLGGTYSGGSGSVEDPYRVTTATDWVELTTASVDWDKNFILTADIDLAGVTLNPIATGTQDIAGNFAGIPFSGTLDGKRHFIKNATISMPNSDYVGLFGCIQNGHIHNLGAVDMDISGRHYVGAIVGFNYQGTISHCYSTGKISGFQKVPHDSYTGGLAGLSDGVLDRCHSACEVSGEYTIGGLVGATGGTVSYCSAEGTVQGKGGVGGLAGYSFVGLIRDSVATGTVSGETYVGGLVGCNSWNATISFCSASGPVNATNDWVGGLVGKNGGDGEVAQDGGLIQFCFASGNVTSTGDFAGGLLGENLNGSISSCYAIGTVKGTYSVGGFVGKNKGPINHCYAKGAATGTGGIGGFAGNHYGLQIIQDCYSVGKVIGTQGQGVGGFLGSSIGINVQSCFWDVETSGQTDSAQGVSKTTAEMMTLSTFTDAKWDFVGEDTNGTADVWRMCADGVDYPRLSWEFSKGGDLACPEGVSTDDLLYLAGRWLTNTPETVGVADANGDGTVDLTDYAILAENWIQ